MQVGVIGVNHKSALLPLREAFALACLRRWGGELPLHGPITYLLLSTCNRSELYFSSEDLVATHTYFLHLLRQEMEYEFEHAVYSYFGYECFFHLACVASGIDSAIVGETEIQGQVRRAYELASTSRPLSKPVHFMFQKCLKISKEVRNSHTLFPLSKALEASVFNAAFSHLPDLNKASVLFIGDSSVNHKILSYFKRWGITHLHLCNRSNSSAKESAKREEIEYLPWEKRGLWPHFDLVIIATKSPHYLLTEVPTSLRHPVVLLDLSLPRNVDPRMGEHPGITLLNIDDLHGNLLEKKPFEHQEIAHIKHHLISKAVKCQVTLFEKREELAQEVFA